MKSLLTTFSILFFLCSFHSFSYAQGNTKRVAILEVIDREGKFSLADKILMRGLITDAVTNTQGFEGYTRTDIDAITKEHDFQRSGMVSESQIKRIGEMTGAEYVLTIEMAKSSGYVTFSSQILSVETGQIVNSGTQLGKDDISTYEESSTKIISKLLGGTNISSPGSLKRYQKGHIWTEEEVKKAGFVFSCDEEGAYPDGFYYTSIEGPNGKLKIEGFYDGVKYLYGNGYNGIMNGLALLSHPSYSEEGEDAYYSGCLLEIAFVVNGKVAAPSMLVAEAPIFSSVSGTMVDPNSEIVKSIDYYNSYRDFLFVDEYVVRDEINFKTDKDHYPILRYLNKIFGEDVSDEQFLYSFQLGKIDMDAIEDHVIAFMNSGQKIPTHIWSFH